MNFVKSEVVFSGNMPVEHKEAILGNLRVKQVPIHSKYLGLPVIFGRRKSDLFKFLVEKICHKIMGWKEKMLSSAGKEILIKSILYAIPQYVMM